MFDRPRLRENHCGKYETILAIIRQIRQFNPDVIHLQQGHLWFNLALPFLKRYPLVITVHDPKYHLGNRESQKTPQTVATFGFRRLTIDRAQRSDENNRPGNAGSGEAEGSCSSHGCPR